MTADERLQLAHDVLARAGADATEVTVGATRQGLTRFTHEAVSQNIDVDDTSVRVRVIRDGRIGIAATNVLDDAAPDAVVARAAQIADLAPRESIPPMLAGAASAATPTAAFTPATAAATAAARARIAAEIFAHARGGLWSSGFVTTSTIGLTIATSAGARMSFDGTDAGANVKMNGTDSTGFAERYAGDVGAIDGDALGAEAARIAQQTSSPIAVDPGDWAVILAPAAIGELLRYVSGHFSAESFSDGSSFISDKIGGPVVSPNMTFRDDYAHRLNPGMPFDYEGVPTQRVALVEAGIARNVVTDSTWARRLNRPNTGHALPAPNTGGPQANHLVVEPGATPVADLVAQTKRGLLITRLWYVRNVDQRIALLTGMTRDGTFLIEDGVIRGGVRNMRFNQAMFDALSDCEVGDTARRTGSYHYSLVTPAIKFNHFFFASASPY